MNEINWPTSIGYSSGLGQDFKICAERIGKSPNYSGDEFFFLALLLLRVLKWRWARYRKPEQEEITGSHLVIMQSTSTFPIYYDAVWLSLHTSWFENFPELAGPKPNWSNFFPAKPQIEAALRSNQLKEAGKNSEFGTAIFSSYSVSRI